MSEKKFLLGNHAAALACIHAGVKVACSYPGTPSTEIMEYFVKSKPDSVHYEWSINEKVALETAVGASYSGVRSMVSMKHVGLNVALDALMTLSYTGVVGGIIIIVADDPGMHSSQNGQDTRNLVKAAKIMCLEPSDSQEIYDMVLEAFSLSEKLDMPIIIRLVTNVSHSSSVVSTISGKKPGVGLFKKNIPKYVMVPQYSREKRKQLIDKQKDIIKISENNKFNKIEGSISKTSAIVCFGSAYPFVKEISIEYPIFKLSTFPVSQKILDDFIKNFENVYIVEEGDPLIEEQLSNKYGNILGKLTGHIPLDKELNPEIIKNILKGGSQDKKTIEIANSRVPVLCPGCPHSGTFYALSTRDFDVYPGDIGCYSLGVQKPFEVMDTLLCMGASIGKAAGLSYSGVKNICALIGDSTFLHSGIASLINAVYNGANFILVIFDNHDVSMTGHQPTPLTGKRADGTDGVKIDLFNLCQSCGVSYVRRFDPYDLKDIDKSFEEVNNYDGVRVLISDRPCALLKDAERKKPLNLIKKDCVKCMECLKIGCTALSHSKGEIVIDQSLCIGCGLCAQLCVYGALK